MATAPKNRRPRRWLASAAVLAALGLSVAACGGGSEPAEAAGSGGKKTTVRVAFNPGTCLNLYAALSKDLFAKHGLDVKLVQFENGAAANAAFASGGVDVGYAGIPGILATRLSTDNKVFMVDNDGADAGGLVVTKKSGIKSVKDLEGKKIGTVIGTTAWVALMNALRAEGVDPAKVKIENVGPPAWIPAFTKGDVDGIWGWAPLIFQMEEAGGTIVTGDAKYLKNPLLWQARGAFVKEHPDAVKAFVAAYDEAAALVEKRDPAFIDKMVELTGSDQAMVLKTVDAVQPVSVADTVTPDSPYSLTSDSGIAAIVSSWSTLLQNSKIIKGAPDLNGLVDPAAAQAAVSSK